jgi:hypothetical protein
MLAINTEVNSVVSRVGNVLNEIKNNIEGGNYQLFQKTGEINVGMNKLFEGV